MMQYYTTNLVLTVYQVLKVFKIGSKLTNYNNKIILLVQSRVI